MNAVILLLATSTLGVDVGWQPLAGGGFEYIIQISPEELASLRDGTDITSEIPPELRGVRRYRITVGTGPVPRIGVQPAAPADFGFGGESSADGTALGAGVSSRASGWDGSGNAAIAGDQTAAGSLAADSQTAFQSIGGAVTDSAMTRIGTTGTTATDDVPTMGENPFRERFATAPGYGEEESRFSAGVGNGNTGGGTSQDASTGGFSGYGEVHPVDLPPGENFGATQTDAFSPWGQDNQTNDPPVEATSQERYPATGSTSIWDLEDKQQGAGNPQGSGTFHPAPGSNSPPGNSANPQGHTNDTQTADPETSAATSGQSGRLSLADLRGNSPFNRDANSNASTDEDDTPPPTFKPDSATRLANYREDEAGPSGGASSSGSNGQVSDAPQGQPAWKWILVVLVMSASIGANGWLGIMLRDSRRKFGQLLDQLHGDEEGYEEEGDEEEYAEGDYAEEETEE